MNQKKQGEEVSLAALNVATGISSVNITLLPVSTSDNIRFLHCSLI